MRKKKSVSATLFDCQMIWQCESAKAPHQRLNEKKKKVSGSNNYCWVWLCIRFSLSVKKSGYLCWELSSNKWLVVLYFGLYYWDEYEMEMKFCIIHNISTYFLVLICSWFVNSISQVKIKMQSLSKCVWVVFQLPEGVVWAPSVHSFKNRLDKFWSVKDVLYNYKADMWIFV